MKVYYDFHIHTALSPCADCDMTPNNIVNMSILKGLDCIAITDHNSCRNIEAVIEVATRSGAHLTVIPGMEIETSEEIHVICLFPSLNIALEFEKYVKSNMPNINNRKEIFGDQLIFDSEDNIINEEERMLITATYLDLYSVINHINSIGGVAIPAHIDRKSYSIISNLGFIPNDLNINLIEISKYTNPDIFMLENRKIIKKGMNIIKSSDAHYLEDISEPENLLYLNDIISLENIIYHLKNNL